MANGWISIDKKAVGGARVMQTVAIAAIIT
jgi:hypothetical protein